MASMGKRLPAAAPLPMPTHMHPDFQKKRVVPPHVKHDQYVAMLHAKATAAKNTAEAQRQLQAEQAERYFPVAGDMEPPAQAKLPPTARHVKEPAERNMFGMLGFVGSYQSSAEHTSHAVASATAALPVCRPTQPFTSTSAAVAIHPATPQMHDSEHTVPLSEDGAGSVETDKSFEPRPPLPWWACCLGLSHIQPTAATPWPAMLATKHTLLHDYGAAVSSATHIGIADKVNCWEPIALRAHGSDVAASRSALAKSSSASRPREDESCSTLSVNSGVRADGETGAQGVDPELGEVSMLVVTRSSTRSATTKSLGGAHGIAGVKQRPFMEDAADGHGGSFVARSPGAAEHASPKGNRNAAAVGKAARIPAEPPPEPSGTSHAGHLARVSTKPGEQQVGDAIRAAYLGVRSPLEERVRAPIHLRGRLPAPPPQKISTFIGDYGQPARRGGRTKSPGVVPGVPPCAASSAVGQGPAFSSPFLANRMFKENARQEAAEKKAIGAMEDECAKTVRGVEAMCAERSEQRLLKLAAMRAK